MPAPIGDEQVMRITYVYVWVNFDAATKFFRQKASAIRRKGPNSSSIAARIQQGGDAFEAARYKKFSPEEGEAIGLYFKFLLAEMSFGASAAECEGFVA